MIEKTKRTHKQIGQAVEWPAVEGRHGNKSANVKDPVCGMDISPDSAAERAVNEGQLYYFCSRRCLAAFRANPDQFAASSLGLSIEREEPSEYTCPMHPEVIRNQPGSCPICGMALEQRSISGNGEDNAELRTMTDRFWTCLILTIPILVIAMGDLVPGRPLATLTAARTWTWIELILAMPVILWGAWPFFVRGWQSIVNRSLNMFTLIGLGVGVAFCYSLVAAVFPELFPASFRDEAGEVAIYFEAAVFRVN